MTATENKSALDYYYWNNKTFYLISNKELFDDFEKSFQNSVILSKKNLRQKKSLMLFYLKNIPRFSKETRDIVMSDWYLYKVCFTPQQLLVVEFLKN